MTPNPKLLLALAAMLAGCGNVQMLTAINGIFTLCSLVVWFSIERLWKHHIKPTVERLINEQSSTGRTR